MSASGAFQSVVWDAFLLVEVVYFVSEIGLQASLTRSEDRRPHMQMNSLAVFPGAPSSDHRPKIVGACLDLG